MSVTRDMAYFAGAVLTSPWWSFQLLRTGKWRTDWRGRFGLSGRLASDGRRTMLIHAVSVGEANLISTLIDQLDQDTGGTWRIVISATTNTGIARARQLYGDRCSVVRYPLDFGMCVRRFLDNVQPYLIALVELEVWPNLVETATQRNIPVCVVNGRLSERSFRRYRTIEPWIRPTFGRLARVAVQTEEYAERFITLGASAERVRVLDSMKWDTAEVAEDVDGSEQLALAMGIDRTRPLIVAGSTAPGEEEMLIETCPQEAQLLLAPRRPERFNAAAGLRPNIIRRSEHPDGSAQNIGARLFLLDAMGELRKAYALADVAIVGRSFLGLYGSNVMEPVALGKPTIIGPYHADFLEIVNALHRRGGIVVTDQPGRIASELLTDRGQAAKMAVAGRDVILSRQGATERHARMLMEIMPSADVVPNH